MRIFLGSHIRSQHVPRLVARAGLSPRNYSLQEIRPILHRIFQKDFTHFDRLPLSHREHKANEMVTSEESQRLTI